MDRHPRYWRRIVQVAGFVYVVAACAGLLGEAGARLLGGLHLFPSLALALRPERDLYLLLALIPFAIVPLYGRLYCTWLCPAGLLQDLAAEAGRRAGVRPAPARRRPRLRLLILAATGTLVLTGSSTWGLFDHFTHVGRVVHEVILPGLSAGVTLFTPVGSEGQALPAIRPGAALYVALFYVGLLSLAAFTRPRWYCATLCPSGTLFAYLARRREPAAPPAARPEPDREGRREFLAGGGALLLGLAAGRALGDLSIPNGVRPGAGTGLGDLAESFGRRAGLFPSDRALALILPPGAGSPSRFYDACVGCGLCAANCPSGVISHAGAEGGTPGCLKPRLDYDRSYCYFKCTRCGDVCPTGALPRLPLATKQLSRLGLARIDERTCIPYDKKRDCGACIEHCPSGAIEMRVERGIRVPSVRTEYCIGCGICQYICPVRPVQAIVVSRPPGMNPVADRKPPAPPKLPTAPAGGNAFPF